MEERKKERKFGEDTGGVRVSADVRYPRSNKSFENGRAPLRLAVHRFTHTLFPLHGRQPGRSGAQFAYSKESLRPPCFDHLELKYKFDASVRTGQRPYESYEFKFKLERLAFVGSERLRTTDRERFAPRNHRQQRFQMGTLEVFSAAKHHGSCVAS